MTIQKAKLSFAALRGVLPRPAKAYSVGEMNDAIVDAAAKRFKSNYTPSLDKGLAHSILAGRNPVK